MKLQLISALLLTISGADAFAPVSRFGTVATSGTARSFGLDPSSFQDLSQHVSFQDLHQHVDSFRDAFTSLTLSDVDVDPSSVMDAAGAATVGASTAAQSGWFGFLTAPIEGLLVLIHSSMVAMGVTSNAWGLSIILLTLVVKAVTFPLTKTQLESTNKMQVCFNSLDFLLIHRVVCMLSHYSSRVHLFNTC
jgi:YidC/Oxa1 family membrane protein insertase